MQLLAPYTTHLPRAIPTYIQIFRCICNPLPHTPPQTYATPRPM